MTRHTATITLDIERVMTFDHRAICTFEESTGLSFYGFLQSLAPKPDAKPDQLPDGLTYTSITGLIWGAIQTDRKNHPQNQITIDDVSDWLLDGNLMSPDLIATVYGLLAKVIAGGTKKANEAAPVPTQLPN